MEQDMNEIEKLAKKHKTTPQRMSAILTKYGSEEAWIEAFSSIYEEMAFEDLTRHFKPLGSFFDKIGIKGMEDLKQYSKKELKLLGVGLGEMERLEGKYGVTFREENNVSELNKSSSLLSLEFTSRVNQILLSNGIKTVEDLLNVSEEELQDLLYDKRGRRGKAGYDTMKEVLKRKSELSETFKSTELETLKDKKEELTAQSKGLEEQTKEAKELLESYEKLAKGTTQADDNSNPDFKD